MSMLLRLRMVLAARAASPALATTQWALRGLVLLAACVVIGAASLAGEPLAVPLLLGLIVLVVPAAWFAESWPAGVLVVGLVLLYAVRATDPLHPASVLAASALLAVHLGGSLAEAGPRQAELPPGLLRRFLRVWLIGTGAAALLWGTARLAVGLPLTPGAAVLLSLTALLGLGVLVLLVLRSVGPPKGS